MFFSINDATSLQPPRLGMESIQEGSAWNKKPKTKCFRGAATGTQGHAKHTLGASFFHPDYTVGSGIPPDHADLQ